MFASVRIFGVLARCTPVVIMAAVAYPSVTVACDGGKKAGSKIPDCEVPACSSTINSLNQAMLGAKKRPKGGHAGAGAVAAAPTVQTSPDVLTGCPIDINVLGASAWNLIHTIAEHIPEDPSEEEQHRISSFMVNLAYLYPCHICRVRAQAVNTKYHSCSHMIMMYFFLILSNINVGGLCDLCD
jgi:hypothetical protein